MTATLLAISQNHPFLVHNQPEFAELLTFLDFAEGLTIGFADVNFAADAEVLIEALKNHPSCADIGFEVLNFSNQPDLRFLRDAILERLAKTDSKANLQQKRVLIVRGLEVVIGNDGMSEYPPVLQDLNFVRDAYRTSVPYPILFVLPDYAVTRIAKYAPDFWAWRSGVFVFKMQAETRKILKNQVFETPGPFIASQENQAQIDQLQRLLMEYHPAGQAIAPENLGICADLHYKLGQAYLTQRQTNKAVCYLQETLKLATQRRDQVLEQSVYRLLGDAYRQARQFDEAIAAYQTSQHLAEVMGNSKRIATALFNLGTVALEQRQFEQARDSYQACLKLEEDEEDRYNQASTYHQLGSVAQELRDYEQAKDFYHQALQICSEFSDRYNQARTYFQLGKVAEALGEIEDAKAYYLQDLEITLEFNDEKGLSISNRNIARFYQANQDEDFLAQVAALLRISSEVLKQAMQTECGLGC
ncbi:MAG: tetratricopeptide repeat protein [Acaryochloris sp. RU_4_1]|nr:tetratricopeptide repeat protein [Acaryochloris sp. RU_4_1]NJR55011.1 tetratricopeptide repeat protein [Acaryochloris sp. CRU_2_0]